MSASALCGYQYLMPVIAIGMAWLWLGEIPTGMTLLGGGIATGGVLLITLTARPEKVVKKPSMGQAP